MQPPLDSTARENENATDIEKRSVIIRGLAASAVPPDTDTAESPTSRSKAAVSVYNQDPAQVQQHPNYNSHEAGASAYLQAPYYEKLTAVVVYEVVGSVTIPYACILCACMLPCPSWGL